MSSPTAGRATSISHHLRATREILQDAIFDVKIATTQDRAEVSALERYAVEVLRLIRSWRNTIAPINKIPPEILALIPDFLAPYKRDRDVIVLTHVCRAWREMFVSRSLLWSNLDCEDGEKTRVYLKRSKSSPISISLDRFNDIYPYDPFPQIIPHTIGRLKSLSVKATPENTQVTISHLSHPAPLLEHLTIRCEPDGEVLDGRPALTSAFFNGDLSSLRTLYLKRVCTGLPWRNMINLTSFTLACTPFGDVSIDQLLGFFEGAPHLREVTLCFATSTAGTQNGRFVSLAYLKSMYIEDYSPSSVLLDHLLIPVGARLETELLLGGPLIGRHLPRSLDNLKNFSNFTTIQLTVYYRYLRMEFSGPNGEVSTRSNAPGVNWTDQVLESLAQLDTSKTKQLGIDDSYPLSSESLYQALLPMTDLCALTLSGSANPYTVIHVLHPGMSSSEVVVCPRLEELVLVLRDSGEKFDMTDVIEAAAARASRGKKLRIVRIVGRWDKVDPEDLLKLGKHVWSVELSP